MKNRHFSAIIPALFLCCAILATCGGDDDEYERVPNTEEIADTNPEEACAKLQECRQQDFNDNYPQGIESCIAELDSLPSLGSNSCYCFEYCDTDVSCDDYNYCLDYCSGE